MNRAENRVIESLEIVSEQNRLKDQNIMSPRFKAQKRENAITDTRNRKKAIQDLLTVKKVERQTDDLLGPNITQETTNANFDTAFRKQISKNIPVFFGARPKRDKSGAFQVFGTSKSGATKGTSGYFYPLFKTSGEANKADAEMGGGGGSHPHTFEGISETFFMPNSEVNHGEQTQHQGLPVVKGTEGVRAPKNALHPKGSAHQIRQIAAQPEDGSVVQCDPNKTPRHIVNLDCIDANSVGGVPAPYCAEVGSAGVCTSVQCGATRHCPSGYWCGNNVCRISKMNSQSAPRKAKSSRGSNTVMVVLILIALAVLLVMGVGVIRSRV